MGWPGPEPRGITEVHHTLNPCEPPQKLFCDLCKIFIIGLALAPRRLLLTAPFHWTYVSEGVLDVLPMTAGSGPPLPIFQDSPQVPLAVQHSDDFKRL